MRRQWRYDSKDAAAGVLLSVTMADPNDETTKRLSNVEEATAWLKDRVWFGTGNLHDRVHKLEDRSADRSFEMEKMKADIQKVERVLGLDGTYGEKSVMSDLRDALDTIQNLKGNVITVKDFQNLMRDVETLKERGKVQLNFWNFVQFGIIGAIIQIIMSFVAKAFGAP
jgi:hypothetical protein